MHEQQYAAQVSAADLENERLTEQADLAEYYFELRGQDELQDIYNKTIDADRAQLDLTQTLYDTGIDDQESVEQAKVTLNNAQEAAIGVAVNRNLYEHAIATLIGKPASSFSLPVKPLTTPVPGIPVGIPSQLLQRRPDIAAAERTMAEANALIGVEKAAYYPNLTLTGSGGVQSSQISTLFSVPALFWSVGSSLSETIFDAGLRRATVDQYTAQYNADVAAYKQTVLTAFQQVEDYNIYAAGHLRTISQAERSRRRRATVSRSGEGPFRDRPGPLLERHQRGDHAAQRSANRGDAACERDDRSRGAGASPRRWMERERSPRAEGCHQGLRCNRRCCSTQLITASR